MLADPIDVHVTRSIPRRSAHGDYLSVYCDPGSARSLPVRATKGQRRNQGPVFALLITNVLRPLRRKPSTEPVNAS